ncbi:MAG: PepSY domain-containing protein, partial [Oscillospiraceae bacterium]|nr:PepSY domain-containing protein [Oscillospiraceae bacterium]
MRILRSSIALILALSVFCALLLAGCGQPAAGQNSDPSAAVAPQAGTADAAAPAPADPAPAASTNAPAAPAASAAPSPAAQLTEQQALDAALAHAGLAAQDVTLRESELDRDDGRPVYELEFHTDLGSFDYVIDAGTGTVLEADAEFRSADTAGAAITEQEAQSIALKHAGVAEADTRSLRTT